MKGSAVSALAPRVLELATRSRRRCLARGASYLAVWFFLRKYAKAAASGAFVSRGARCDFGKMWKFFPQSKKLNSTTGRRSDAFSFVWCADDANRTFLGRTVTVRAKDCKTVFLDLPAAISRKPCELRGWQIFGRGRRGRHRPVTTGSSPVRSKIV